MRVQVYPLHGVVFVGTTTHRLTTDEAARAANCTAASGTITFDTSDTDHPLWWLIVHRRPPERVPIAPYGRARAVGTDENGHRVNTFYFERAGHELPLHDHDERTVHTSLVVRGRLRMITDEGTRDIGEGTFLDWAPGQRHGFIALEDDCVLRNVVKRPLETA